MKIVVACPQYWPTIGGLPIVTQLLCRELARAGHDIVLFTLSPEPPESKPPTNREAFRIVRKPSVFQQIRLYLWCDGVIVMQPNLRLGTLARLAAPRCLLAHHGFQNRGAGLAGRLRHALTKLLRLGAREAACSRWLARKLGPRVGFVPNPYDDSIFLAPANGGACDIDVLFVASGLTADKGVFLLCDAIGSPALARLVKQFVIVAPPFGEDRLRRHIRHAGIEGVTEYKGALPPHAVADLMRRSRVLAAPSAWNEPFGLVALEAAACDAIVVASRDGGLPEAAGPDALIVEPGDVEALAAAIKKGLLSPAERHGGERNASVAQFLDQHTPSAAASRYVEALFGANHL